MSGQSAREPSQVLFWGGVISAFGLGLVVLQLAAEIFSSQRFGPSYVGLFVLGIGAALMALACVASMLPKK